MKCTVPLALLLLAAVAPASAATLTITPDKQTYEVGETITLSVFGDPEGEVTIQITGTILFDPSLAAPVSAQQSALTFAGGIPWVLLTLLQGEGFSGAFNQFGPDSLLPVENTLMATVVLLASAPGVLSYEWATEGPGELSFVGLSTAPGGSITIIPEPATGLLLLAGLISLSRPMRGARGSEIGSYAKRRPSMKSTLLVALLLLAAAAPAGAATLSITPDKQTYQVGETITLSVLGDPEGDVDLRIDGRILFDSGLAAAVSAQQNTLTFAGGIPWLTASLLQGAGFADAFDQIGPDFLPPVDNTLVATVILLASAPGVLTYEWNTTGATALRFFGLTTAPGGSVTIIPEPATGLLLLAGLIALSRPMRRARGSEIGSYAKRRPSMKSTLLLALLLLAAAAPAGAAALTVTPDKQTYQVGETITLSVFGDPEGAVDLQIDGTVLFDPILADPINAQQSTLTFFGGIPWTVAPLDQGDGFSDAFDQIGPDFLPPVDAPLTATVVLMASAPGVLSYEWLTEFTPVSPPLRFFGLTTAPGGSVTIVPEPATGLLLLAGLITLSRPMRRARGSEIGSYAKRRPSMKRTLLVALLLLAAVAQASAATLTITPDKQTYQVGETITLSVFGDPEGAVDLQVNGTILFDSVLAVPINAHQEPLTFAGGIPWSTAPLQQGEGFSDAFDQVGPNSLIPVENTLTATVVLLASAPGVLSYEWLTEFTPVSLPLRFFGLTTASGGSVTIIPEPAPGLLLLAGLAALARKSHVPAHRRQGRTRPTRTAPN